MKICSVLLLTTLTTISAFAQDHEAKASMIPAEVTAGKNITVTITVDDGPSLEQTSIGITLAPKDPKDNAQPFGTTLSPKSSDPKVYSVTVQVPPNGKGVWTLRNAALNIPQGGSVPLETNSPEFIIKPIKNSFPKKGTADITVP